MATFSVMDAVVSGFGVIGRKPLAVLVWGVVMALLLLAPLALLFALMGEQFVAIFEMASKGSASGAEPDPEQFRKVMALQSGLMGFNLLNWVWGTFVRALICAAVFRAVLTPADSRQAYLRLGAQELWLTLLFLVEAVLALIVFVAAAMAAGILVAIGYAAMGQGGGETSLNFVLFCGAVSLAMIVGLLWVALRLSMAAPMTFADREFRLFESWSMTRGQGWRLLAVAILLILIFFAVEVVLAFVVFGGVFGVIGGSGVLTEPERIEAFFRQPPAVLIRVLWPWVAAGGAIWIVLTSILMTVFCAPWAAIYGALTASAAPNQDISPSGAAAS